jgi:hypothetical protein
MADFARWAPEVAGNDLGILVNSLRPCSGAEPELCVRLKHQRSNQAMHTMVVLRALQRRAGSGRTDRVLSHADSLKILLGPLLCVRYPDGHSELCRDP